MLNELREYEEYTLPIEKLDGDNPRLLPAIFKGEHCGGSKRALTIIARKYLFDNNYYEADSATQATLRENTKNLLRSWCGMITDNGLSGEYASLNGWLKNYCEKYDAYPSMPKNTSNKWEYFLKMRKKNWDNASTVNTLIYYSSINATNFDMVIADAIQRGPLCEYFLVCDDSFRSNIKNVVSSKTTDSKPKLKNPNDDQIERLLKQIAAYLCECQFAKTKNKYLPVTKVDVANWMNYLSFGLDTHSIDYIYMDKSIIKFVDGRMKVSQAFLQNFSFDITKDVESYIASHPGQSLTFYKDFGSGVKSLRALEI